MGWTEYALKRLLISAGLMLGASAIVFAIVRLIPGGPAEIILGQFATEESIQALRRQLGLNRPVWQQYLVWLSDVLAGNWGRSLINDKSVMTLLVQRYPRSLLLAAVSMVIAVAIAFPLGILGALNRNTTVDYLALFFSQVGVSIPSFVLGIFFILVFGRHLDVLPPSGYAPILQQPIAGLKHLIMPGAALGIVNAATITRLLRSEMLEQVSQDYVRTARAFGHSTGLTIVYILRNALIPTVTIIGIQFGYMIAGMVIIEQVFAYPGVGQLLLNSILRRDYTVVQLTLLLMAATFITVNLVVDLAYGWLNPKIRY